MATYMIVYDNVSDMEQFSKYAKAVEPLIQKGGGTLVAGGAPDILEGDFPWERAVVFEWQSRQAALDFWHSSEYAEIKKLRAGIAQFQAILLDGIAFPQAAE